MQLNFHYVRIDSQAIFDSLTIAMRDEDRKIELVTVRYLDMLDHGDYIESKLSTEVELVSCQKIEILSISMKILNLLSDETRYELPICPCYNQQIKIECEYCLITLCYSIERLVMTPQINKNIEQFTRYLRSENRPNFESPKDEITELRETNRKLERDIENIRQDFVRYHRSIDRKIQEMEERSNEVMLKSLRHQRNELQCRGNWEKERQMMLLKVDGLKKLLDQVHTL